MFALSVVSVSMQPSSYGKIAFSSNRDGNSGHQIFVMNPDGSNQVKLTNTLCTSVFPTWSSDGTRIAFNSSCETIQAYIIDADGSNMVNISISEYDNGWPAWSPDGEKIALWAYSDGISGIFVITMKTGSVANLTTVGDDPSWSPDGKKIAFSRGNSIGVINVDGTGLKWITDHGSYPEWSPDGEKIAFCSKKSGNWEIYVIDADGSNQVNLTNNPAHDMVPTWSPDGERIAFDSNRDGNDEIYVMNADGSNQINLTNNPASDRDPDWCCHPLLVEEPLFKMNFQLFLLIVVLIVISVIIIFSRHRTDSES